jgi:pimeloyl-ACP methyl ester carboxylesterase
VTKPSIVFAHGLWADGSCFSKLIPTLQTEGHDVMASQHGLDSLATDVAAVKACLARVSSPAILVGHSYGGTLITHAGTDARVAALVYIAALAPDADETSQSLLDKFPKSLVFDHLDVPEGRVWLKQSGVKHFAGDLPEAEQKLVYATQAAPVSDLFNQAGGRPLQPEGRGYSVERQAELVCPRHPGPDGSPGSATFCLETDESRHDRSHVISRSHAVEARCGPRCHPQGREHGLSVLIPVVHFGCRHVSSVTA